jgi:biopolymer transport protein ExbB
MAVFIVIERLLALRTSRVMPKALTEAFVSGDIMSLKGDLKSSAGRIVYFFRRTNPEPEALKAFARLEIARLERGMFVLEIVISGAPLLGLLGTIAGLAKVFSAEASTAAAAAAGAADIAGGISLALTTTMLGLCIAIPTLVGNSYLNRRVDLLSARLDMGVERLIDLAKRK